LDGIENLSGGIFIKPRNKMTGRINIIGIGSETMGGSILVKKYVELPSQMIVYSDEVIINPSYPPVVGNQRKGNMTIPYRLDISGNIKIPPKNKMTGTVEVLEPPTYYLEIESEKDTFVRSQIPTLNYGDTQSMVVGYRVADNDVFRSLVKFDTEQIPENADIKSVKLRLFNRQNNARTHQVGVYSVSSDWLEYGTTWINQPAIKDIITIADVGELGYTDIDVTNIVKRWYDKKEDNYGFLLRALNETVNQDEQFSTRENSVNKPFLDIEYKLNIIYSVGRSSLESSIFVYAYGKSDLKGSINIPQFDADKNMPSSIHIRNLNWMLEADILISKPDLPSSIVIKRTEENALEANLSVRVKGGHLPSDNLNSNIGISKPWLDASMNVRRPIISEWRSIDGNIIVSKPILTASLTVKRKNDDDLNSSMTVMFSKDLQSEMIVNKPILSGSMLVTYYDGLNSSITIKNTSDIESSIVIPYRKDLNSNLTILNASKLEGSIQVLSGFLRASIVVPHHGDSIKMANMTVRVVGISELNSSINVGGDNILGGYVYLF